MFLASLLLALQLGATPAPAPDPRLACAPRINMSAAGPPPPVFFAQRLEEGARVELSVHECRDADYRVERRITQGDRQVGSHEWVPVSQCALLGGWIEATTRLRLPAPMLTPHRTDYRPTNSTWFTLNSRLTAGSGAIMGLELQMLEPAGVPPNALSQWFRDGERLFKTCRDQGHGGSGYAPRRGWGRQ